MTTVAAAVRSFLDQAHIAALRSFHALTPTDVTEAVQAAHDAALTHRRPYRVELCRVDGCLSWRHFRVIPQPVSFADRFRVQQLGRGQR